MYVSLFLMMLLATMMDLLPFCKYTIPEDVRAYSLGIKKGNNAVSEVAARVDPALPAN